MSLIDSVARLAADLFTDPRLFGKPARYARKGGLEIDVLVTEYKSDESSLAFAGTALDVRTKEFLIKTESLKDSETRIVPKQDDKILFGGAVFKVVNGENKKPFRYLDATESMIIVKTQRFGKDADS